MTALFQSPETPYSGFVNKIESLCSSKALTIDDLQILNKTGHVNLNRSQAMSNQSNRSKYTNRSKLTRSELYQCIKKSKTSRKKDAEEERQIEIELLTQSLDILERQKSEFQLNLQEEFQNQSQNCQEIIKKLNDI